MRQILLSLFAVWLCHVETSSAAAQPPAPETTVGMTGRFDQVVLPGSELEVIPNTDRKSAVVLRIAHAFPHGTSFRYDLEYQGLEPGQFDLKDYLRRKDGSSTADLPPLPVRVAGLLPPGQILPNAVPSRHSPWLGGYFIVQGAALIVWIGGLLTIIYLGFLRKRHRGREAIVQPVSLADRLRPLVDGAIAGRLSKPELANLERSLFAYWRKQLKVEKTDPAEAMAALRSHDEAGPLLEQLDDWLHRPQMTRAVDVAHLLEPYRRLPADALERIGS